MVNSKALTKIQTVISAAIIVVAAFGGTVVYIFLSEDEQTAGVIKIGILVDLDGARGRHVWQGAVLAAEHLNAEGGILGKRINVFGEDTDEETRVDLVKISAALTRLLTLRDVDFVVTSGSGERGYVYQDIIAEHKKILISYGGSTEGLTQRVIDDYNKYKYFFRYSSANTTSIVEHAVARLLHAREITGFNNVGYLADDHSWTAEIRERLDYILPEVYGFNLVYKGTFPPFDTLDFSSYFAVAEKAEVEILVPFIMFDSGIAFVKEYYDRQSPMIIYDGNVFRASQMESWEQTDGKCIYTTNNIQGVTIGYPITSKTLPFRDSYIERWSEAPNFQAASSYDIIRFVLFDALERAGTNETEEIIKALEETDIETTRARKFAFTSSHDVLYIEGMTGNPDTYGHVGSLFQWLEGGSLVPIWPKWLMEEAGATYTYPPWEGPWDEQ